MSSTGTSGSETVVVTLNSQTYMELQFNYDSQTTQVTRTYDFQTSEGSESSESSGSESSQETPSGEGENSSSDEEGVQ